MDVPTDAIAIINRFSLGVWSISGLTRNVGAAEPVSKDQIIRHERGRVNIIFLFSRPRAGLVTVLARSTLNTVGAQEKGWPKPPDPPLEGAQASSVESEGITGPDGAVMRNSTNTHTHTQPPSEVFKSSIIDPPLRGSKRVT